MLAVGIATWVALSAFLGRSQHSRLADTSVAMPASVIGLRASADPAIQSQVDQLADRRTERVHPRRPPGTSATARRCWSRLPRPKHVLTLAEQESLTRSFWAQAGGVGPEGSSLAAPSTPRAPVRRARSPVPTS
jgi:hypothetical protein